MEYTNKVGIFVGMLVFSVGTFCKGSTWRHIMGKLTATGVKKSKPEEKVYRISDGGGLFLEVRPNGSKYWRYNYRFFKKQKTLAIGVYPVISLARARELHLDATKVLSEGVDPNAHKKALKATEQFKANNSFKAVAEAWCLHHLSDKSESYKVRSHRILKNDLYPAIGAMAIDGITPPMLLAALRKVETRTVDIAHRAMQLCGLIFRYAVQEGVVERDPTQDLKGALKSRKVKHHAAIKDPAELSGLLRAIDGYQGTIVVKVALQLSPMLFQRPNELRQMAWEDINWSKCCWELPAIKMKMANKHSVPLPTQAMALLKAMHQLTGSGVYVFPSARGGSRPLSDNGLRTALRTMGYTNEQVTPHGFRATARTMLDEVLKYRVDIIEQQLAHAVKDPLGRAYNRTTFIDDRSSMMQMWANYLDAIKSNPSLSDEELKCFKGC